MAGRLGRSSEDGGARRGSPGVGALGEVTTSPFQRQGRVERVAVFAVVAVVAEASLLLPPGPRSAAGAAVSLVLLVAVATSFALPWDRLPAFATVLVPLAYTGSVLALVLATGQSASGIGIVVLVPLLWTALFHRRWESLCVVGAVAAVELVTSLVPVAVPDAVLIRRVVLWTVLGLLVVLAVHGLRDRAARARHQVEEAHDQLHRLALLDDRARIGRQLYESTIHRLVGVGFLLEATSSLATLPVQQRIDEALRDLDESVRHLRATIFDLGPTPVDGTVAVVGAPPRPAATPASAPGADPAMEGSSR